MSVQRVMRGVVSGLVIGCGSGGASNPPGTPRSVTPIDAVGDAGPLGPDHVISHGTGFGAAPTSPAAPPETSPNQAAVRVPCTNPRLSICTKQFQPVCGDRDTGIRCIQAPCPSTERRTFGNACEACAEPSVVGYTPGACPAAP